MGKFYPDIGKLFDNVGKGRKSRYTPEQICEEFKRYIEDLSRNVIEVENNYRYQSDDGSRRQQRRTQSYARPPKITDFVYRWLGMTHQWWYALPNGKRGSEYKDVIDRITRYCYDVKFDGAAVGLYNANIIARDLGLRDSLAIAKADDLDDMSKDDIDNEISRLEKIYKK